MTVLTHTPLLYPYFIDSKGEREGSSSSLSEEGARKDGNVSMSAKVFALIIAALSGVTMAVQGSINSVLGKVIGLWEANLIVHIIGTITVGVILFVLKLGNGNLLEVGKAPWFTFTGGLLSALIIYGVVTSIPKLGVAVATTSIIVGQVLAASIIDHFGLFGLRKIPFDWYQLLGLVFLAIGARLLLNNN